MLRRLSRLLTLAAALTLPSLAHAQRADESPHRIDIPDPTWDGAVKGALLGAGAMAGTLTVLYARCDAGCEAPAEGPMYAWGLGVGAGSGAAVGWLIDKLHAPRKAVPTVAIRADRREKAVRLAWSF